MAIKDHRHAYASCHLNELTDEELSVALDVLEQDGVEPFKAFVQSTGLGDYRVITQTSPAFPPLTARLYCSLERAKEQARYEANLLSDVPTATCRLRAGKESR